MNIFKKTVTLAAAVSLVCLSSTGAMAAQKLIVKAADGTTNKLVITDDGTGLSAPDSGFVGIGTATPARPLDVVGETTSSDQIMVRFNATNTNGGGGILLYHNNAANALPASGDRLGYLLFGGFDGATGRNGCGIVSRAESTWVTGGTVPSFFAFETTASNTRTEKMRITGSGNVGIGVTAPTSKLAVAGLPGPFANNADALTGGLHAGDFYITGTDPSLVAVVQ